MGAWWEMILKQSKYNLYWIHCSIGSQWREWSIGVTWADLVVVKMSLFVVWVMSLLFLGHCFIDNYATVFPSFEWYLSAVSVIFVHCFTDICPSFQWYLSIDVSMIIFHRFNDVCPLFHWYLSIVSLIFVRHFSDICLSTFQWYLSIVLVIFCPLFQLYVCRAWFILSVINL